MKKFIKWVTIVLLIGAAIAAGVWVAPKLRGQAEPMAAPAKDLSLPVALSEVREMTFEDRLKVSGNVEARETAVVSARIPGVLDEIFVDEGDAVTAGETKLFQTDKIKLTRALESAGQQVAVAGAAVRARAATVARIHADLAKVQLDYDRYKRLYDRDKAVTRSALEAQESHLKQVQAGLAEAEAGLELARAQEQQANSARAISAKDLADSLVVAPISGKVSMRLLEPGEMAGAGTPVLRIEDPSVVELVGFLPESCYARVVEGKTILRARCGAVDVGEVVVTTKAPTIHPRLRTFEIKALVKSPPSGVVPGARVDLTVVLARRDALGVPRVSVVRRAGGLAVFAVDSGKARMLPVKAGLEMSGWVEVHGEGLTAESRIVRMGQGRLNDGAAVTEVEEGAE